MREILFRGKRIDNGEWVEGCLAAYDMICPDYSYPEDTTNATGKYYGQTPYVGFVNVDPSTVGQYTGLADKNGKRIFEGDIVEGADFNDEDGYGAVEWDDGAFEVGNGQWCGTFHENYNGSEFEKIGNIYDNPELMEVAARA